MTGVPHEPSHAERVAAGVSATKAAVTEEMLAQPLAAAAAAIRSLVKGALLTVEVEGKQTLFIPVTPDAWAFLQLLAERLGGQP
ncbi:MAG: hypothetical protein ACRDYC_08515 [Acidimicrobiales bacterium]